MKSVPATRKLSSQTAKSAVLVLCGLGLLAKHQLAGQGAVIAFHGLRADDEPAGVQDADLHLPVSIFRGICEHLAAKYHVMPLSEMAACLQRGEKLPARAVALSFDDGYASNYELAFPILRELKLPATIFLATGFLDGTDPLWFQQVDLVMRQGAKLPGQQTLNDTLVYLKSLSNTALREQVQSLLSQVTLPSAPKVTRPMSWEQVHEMQRSGWIEFGGHTHSHPILARCSVEQQRLEIETCRDRICAELGVPPRLFAFPNGGKNDCTSETLHLLAAAGFDSAWTMVSGRATPCQNSLLMPRYGSPASLWEAEATVSGAFELLRQWRGGQA